jgi:DNA-binding MarR family transcriptional regulator
MKQQHHQPKLDFGESAEAERDIERRVRAQRAKTFEAAAARVLKMRAHEAGYKLAGTLAVFVDSPSTRAAGITGLRWTGTLAELAARVGCSADTVARILRRFRAAGWVDTWQTTDDRGRVSGVGVELQIRQIAIDAALDPKPMAAEHPTPVAVAATVPGADPVTVPGAYPGADHRIGSAYYISDLPPNPNTPPPPKAMDPNNSKPGETGKNRNPDSKRAPNRENGVAAAVCGVDAAIDWGTAGNALRVAGVARVISTIRAAQSQNMTPADVVAVCDQYAANRHRLNGPGALVDRITNGDWPAELGPATPKPPTVTPAKREQWIEFARADCIAWHRAKGISLDGVDVDAIATAAVEKRIAAIQGTP